MVSYNNLIFPGMVTQKAYRVILAQLFPGLVSGYFLLTPAYPMEKNRLASVIQCHNSES